MAQGKLIILSAPSGSGKTTLVRYLLSRAELKLCFSISATTRSKRKEEQDGEDYYFMSVDAFREQIADGDLLEWEEVYENQYYGTLRSEIARVHAEGKHVIFDVDVVGGLKIKEQFGKQALAVFVQPPSIAEIEKRLRSRSSESEESLKKRLDKAQSELGFARLFDAVLVNDDLEKAKEEAYSLVKAFLS